MPIIRFFKCYVSATAALLLTTGCVHDIHYVSAKHRHYDNASAFHHNRITASSWVGAAAEPDSSARYTSSNIVAHERYRSAVLGTLYIHHSDNPEDGTLAFAIRKENRAYMAETPLFNAIEIGKKKITPSFTMGHHRDHKIMAGLNFRMPF